MFTLFQFVMMKSMETVVSTLVIVTRVLAVIKLQANVQTRDVPQAGKISIVA